MKDYIKRACNHCGKEYIAKVSRLKFGRQIFCSRECSYKSRRKPTKPPTQRFCELCKKEFYRRQSGIKRKDGKSFCSRECHYKARAVGLSIRVVIKPYNKQSKPLRRVEVVCKTCQKKVLIIPAKKERTKYCSKICYTNHKRLLVRGKDNPAYKDGSSLTHRSHRGADWERIRKTIYERDNYTCQECGARCIGKRDAKKGNTHLVIQCHHKKKYRISKNNSQENLITLCLKCHLKIEKEMGVGLYKETV